MLVLLKLVLCKKLVLFFIVRLKKRFGAPWKNNENFKSDFCLRALRTNASSYRNVISHLLVQSQQWKH